MLGTGLYVLFFASNLRFPHLEHLELSSCFLIISLESVLSIQSYGLS